MALRQQGLRRTQPFLNLPEELIAHIISFLGRPELKALCLVCDNARNFAIGPLWEYVDLLDCQTSHEVPADEHEKWAKTKHAKESPVYGVDMHDDTPIIKKLLLLASDPLIASNVQVLTHRCHLPTPAIFRELESQSYYGATLSNDLRTWQLLRLAIQNMTNVHTLRIINGHYFLTAILLRGFFSLKRKANRRIRRLWLESCAVDSLLFPSFCDGYPLRKIRGFNMSGLQSLRVRRVRMDNCNQLWVHARGGTMIKFHNGKGSLYPTTVYQGQSDCVSEPPLLEASRSDPEFVKKYPYVDFYNRSIRRKLPEVDKFLDLIEELPEDDVCDELLDENSFRPNDKSESPIAENVPPCPTFTLAFILGSVSATLTSLNLDWLLMNKNDDKNGLFFCGKLSKLRFPHLRAFQFRNANSSDTELPWPVYLLHPYIPDDPSPDLPDWKIDFLEFMEAHPALECLGWPMDRFYSHERVDHEEAERARVVVMELGRSLISLRLDAEYSLQKDVQTDEHTEQTLKQERTRRRKFTSQFAAHMTKLNTLKMEGAVPRDEKREVLRALHRCPLEHLVFISLNYPIGNSLGGSDSALPNANDGDMHAFHSIEDEAEEAIAESTTMAIPATDPKFEFQPEYGWPPGPPLVFTIATHFADTITELKFCGPGGSPILQSPTAITSGLLHHLKHFHNLRHLITSFSLLTFFDFDWRELEIIKYWLDQQDGGTALVVAETPPAEQGQSSTHGQQGDIDDGPTHDHQMIVTWDWEEVGGSTDETPNVTEGWGDLMELDEPNDVFITDPPILAPDVSSWEITLKERFSPPAMAKGMYEIFGPHLSPKAKARTDASGKKVGVEMRASFCIGVEQEDIFDFEAWLGENGPLRWRGPRPEADMSRYWGKLERRLWF